VNGAWKVGHAYGAVVLTEIHRHEPGATILGGMSIASRHSGGLVVRRWDNLRIDHATGEARILPPHSGAAGLIS
jgi:hypothetical protein